MKRYNPPPHAGLKWRPVKHWEGARMQTIELLEQLQEVAQRMGYGVRQEYLGGVGGGACEFNGKRWIFLDLALSAVEQLEQLAAALEADPVIHVIELAPEVRRALGLRRAA
jgi:hypothetical protein